jgi:inner membrane protease subunit SOM1
MGNHHMTILQLTSSNPTSCTPASNFIPSSAAIDTDNQNPHSISSASLPAVSPTMAPVVESFPVSELATRAQYIANGKRRKPPVNLKDCELKEMLAFNCDLNGPQSDVRSRIKCESIMRTFRV